jgi:hypothetical protein
VKPYQLAEQVPGFRGWKYSLVQVVAVRVLRAAGKGKRGRKRKGGERFHGVHLEEAGSAVKGYGRVLTYNTHGRCFYNDYLANNVFNFNRSKSARR